MRDSQRTDIKSGIKRFYEVYHQRRVRLPDSWVRETYWPLLRGKILEVGAGTMFPALKAYMAIDLTFVATRRAQDSGIPALMADGSMLPFPHRSFDTVACYDVLEHVLEPEQFLREMCRVSRDTVVVAGPNYVGEESGGLDRYLPTRVWKYLLNRGKGYVRVENPSLTYDEHWEPDRDVVCKPNAGFVTQQFRHNGYRVCTLRTWEHAYPFLNKFPVLRCLGQFMLVVGRC